ncbi:MAG: alpha/beta hydrolase [Microbacterium sp.]|uniref:alpha/beta fold hydrolase n=1 Tax=Microbacterium sp. TaxID=51671 RepID=UPI0027165D04|nr:alpha/beta hydrolase [Microbacterium sp.]MDO8381992.1 alpha/beta hydrolase [Microbacterium sp.]
MTVIDDAPGRDRAIPDLDWRVFPDGTVRDVLEAPSGSLARVRLGPNDGPRVLLFPGVTGSKEDFVLMFPLLAAAGYRVESLDLAGQYESWQAGPANLHPPRSRYDYRLFADDMIAALEDGAVPVHVLGYSFAGLVAQQVLVERPDLFASLTLLSTPPGSGQVFRGVKRIGRWSSGASPRTGAALLMWGIRNNLNRVPPRRIAFVRERFALTRRDSVNDIVGLMMTTPDVAADVAAQPIPKLVAVGERDLWPSVEYANYARAIGAELRLYPTGHSPCETTPHQLTRDMLAMFDTAR